MSSIFGHEVFSHYPDLLAKEIMLVLGAKCTVCCSPTVLLFFLLHSKIS